MLIKRLRASPNYRCNYAIRIPWNSTKPLWGKSKSKKLNMEQYKYIKHQKNRAGDNIMTNEAVATTNNNHAVPDKLTTTPISREELAIYFKYGYDTINEKITALMSRNEELEKNIEQIGRSVAQAFEVVSMVDTHMMDFLKRYLEDESHSIQRDIDSVKLIGDIQDNTYTMYHSLSDKLSSIYDTVNNISSNNIVASDTKSVIALNDTKEWLSKAWNTAEIIGKNTKKSKYGALQDIYDAMRSDGVNLNILYAKYKKHSPYKAMINMIADDSGLRASFEKSAKVMLKNVTKEKDEIISYSTVISMPDDIRAGYKKYMARHSLKSKAAVSQVLAHKMNKLGKIDLSKMRKDKAAELHYSQVSLGYLIDTNPMLKDLFNRIVEND